MQIILISSRTLGASELLLCLSLFSHLFFFFSLLFVFLPLLFLKSIPPLRLLRLLLLSIAAIRLPPFSSPLVSSLYRSFMALSLMSTRPGLTLSRWPIHQRVRGRFGQSYWVRVGDSGYWCHFWHPLFGADMLKHK